MSEAEQLLNRTYQFFLTHEWGQGSTNRATPPGGLGPREECYCLVGGVCHMANKCNFSLYVTGAALALLRAKIARGSIVKWNDTPGRTKDQVLSLLLEASQ